MIINTLWVAGAPRSCITENDIWLFGSTYTTIVPPSIVIQPVNLNKTERDIASFSVIAFGFPVPSYQWYFNGTPIINGGRISGATSGTLTITNTSSTDTGNYAVTVSNMMGSVTSSVAVLTVPPEKFGNGQGYRQTTLDIALSTRFKRPFGQVYDYPSPF